MRGMIAIHCKLDALPLGFQVTGEVEWQHRVSFLKPLRRWNGDVSRK